MQQDAGCPNCGSYKVTRRTGLVWAGVALLGIALFLPFFASSLISTNLSGMSTWDRAWLPSDAVSQTYAPWLSWALWLGVLGAAAVVGGMTMGSPRCANCGYPYASWGYVAIEDDEVDDPQALATATNALLPQDARRPAPTIDAQQPPSADERYERWIETAEPEDWQQFIRTLKQEASGLPHGPGAAAILADFYPQAVGDRDFDMLGSELEFGAPKTGFSAFDG